jgi:hypothetical protein
MQPINLQFVPTSLASEAESKTLVEAPSLGKELSSYVKPKGEVTPEMRKKSLQKLKQLTLKATAKETEKDFKL